MTQDIASKKYIKSNQLRNSPILDQDMISAKDIFGPSLACLKDKTARRGIIHARVELTKIPITILEKYQKVSPFGDVMHINDLRVFSHCLGTSNS